MPSSRSSDPSEQLLSAASRGDLPAIKALLSAEGDAQAQPWYESPSLGWSALHFAAEHGHAHCINYLLRNGAIWNAVDVNGVTAGEVAWSGNWTEAYAALLEEGVRQTLLLGSLEEQQGQGGDDDDDETGNEANAAASGNAGTANQTTQNSMTLSAPTGGEVATSNRAFLASPLRFFTDEAGKERCLDQDSNMVMAGWETEIMRRTAALLCEDLPERYEVHDEDGEVRTEGFSVLNIGYGLGIVDDFFQGYKPARHVIVEPHPDAVAFFKSRPIAGAEGVQLVEKTWEEALLDPEFAASLGDFDVVYADPFAQDYKHLKRLFDVLPNLLSGPKARFSFFHGLAGTNRFFYDVYTRVAELDLRDVGLETEWHSVPVRFEDRQEVWKGVKREYWSLDEFRLPICKMGIF